MSITSAVSAVWLRHFPPKSIIAGKISPKAKIQPVARRNRDGASTFAVAAAVLTTRDTGVVVRRLLAVTEGGEKVHFAAGGNPEQAKLIDPLKPVEVETLNGMDPVAPGAE